MTRGPTATTVTTGGVGAGRKGSSEYPHSPKAVHPSMSTPTTGSFGSTVADKPVRIKTTAATTANEEV